MEHGADAKKLKCEKTDMTAYEMALQNQEEALSRRVSKKQENQEEAEGMWVLGDKPIES